MPTHPISSALILAGCLHATVKLYRCIHLQEQLAPLGVAADVQEWHDQSFPPDTAGRYDLLVLQRTAMSVHLRRLIDSFHAQGKPVIFDTDDVTFEPEMVEWHRGAAQLLPHERQLYADGVERTLATLMASDYVLTASPLLAELAQRRGKPSFVHRNAVGQEMQTLGDPLYAARSRRHQPSGEDDTATKVIIGYGSGTRTHDLDFEEVAPALLDILARYPGVELWLMGPLAAPPTLDIFGARVRRYPLLEWRGYLELASRLDIMLAPLERGNLFCRAKSEIKFVEAGLLGIPTVASRIDPFAYAIEHGVDGFLAANTAEWIEAIEALVSQPTLRQSIGEAAHHKVTQRYTPPPRTADLAETLAKISSTWRSGKNGRVGEWGSRGAEVHQGEIALPLSPTPPPLHSPTPLVLNWVVTEPFRGSGGHLGVFRIIQNLVAFGHECHVYVVPVEQMHEYSAAEIRRYVDRYVTVTGAHFHRWTGRVHDADAIIATYWTTAYDVAKLPDTAPRYYFVQDFEPSFYPVGSDYVRAENTYRLGFHAITLGRWLAKLMRERYGATADYFDFAVDTDIYWPQPQPRPTHPRVAFYARPSTPRRAYELGIEALDLVKRRYPETEIILFGANDLELPPYPVTSVGVRNQWELATLYSTCDVGLVLSLTNPSFVPLEMMACKCAVVDLQSERVEGLLEQRQTARLAEPTPESIADAVLELLWDRELRTAIVERAYAQVRELSWQASARQIERVLLDRAPAPDERCLARRTQGGTADSLLWQINQLMDQRQGHEREVAQLEERLSRALAEQARLSEQVRRLEQSVQSQAAAPAGQAITALRSAPLQTLSQAPAWMHRFRPLGKLPLGSTPLRQHFVARASHLCRLELPFARHQPDGALRITLHAPLQGEPLVVERTVSGAELQSDLPYLLDFAPQPYSSGRTYLLTITATDAGRDFALWRYWLAPDADASLHSGDRPLRGQLLFQLAYQESLADTPAPVAPAWADQPQPLTTVVREVGGQKLREGSRLAQKSWQTFRTHGLTGLLREFVQYVQWHYEKRIKP